MITLTFPVSYVPVLIAGLQLMSIGMDKLSEPIANVIKRKSQTTADIIASLVVGILFLIVGVVVLVITWPQ